MSRSKLRKFQENKNFSNLIQSPDKINWPEFFGNSYPVTIELACGKGDYTLALAKMFPKRNFIGVDIKGARLWRGAKTALKEELKNVAFLRIQIEDLENYFLPHQQKIPASPASLAARLVCDESRRESRRAGGINHKSSIINQVTDIWITFPDPFPKKRHIKKRLTSPRFLKIYKKILTLSAGDQTFGRLQERGRLRLKTDDLNLFNYSVDTADACGWQTKKIINNIYAQKNIDPLLQVQTTYEKKHLNSGEQINYLELTLPRLCKNPTD